MSTLAIIPTQAELERFVQACHDQGCHAEAGSVGRLAVTTFPQLGLVAAHGGLGKVQFAIHTQHLLDAAAWDVAICAGAAGALAEDLAIGDLVIATETVEHDIRNRFGQPLLPRFAAPAQLVERCHRVAQRGLGCQAHFGPIASGDEDVVDAERRQAIQARTGALAVAWEGAGGARACQFSGVHYLEVRGVSDRADSTAPQDFLANLALAMGSVARLVIALAQGERNA